MKKQIVFGIVFTQVAFQVTLVMASVAVATTQSGKRLSGIQIAQNSQTGLINSDSGILNKKKKKKKKRPAPQKAAAIKPVPAAPTPRVAAKPAQPTNRNLIAGQNNSVPVAPSASIPRAVSPPTVISTPIAKAKAAVTKSPFSFKYRSYNAMDLSTIENRDDGKQDHELRAWDRFNFTYNFTENVSVSVMPQLYHTWFGDSARPQDSSIPALQQPYASYLGDTAVYLADSKLASLPGGLTLDGVTSWFFPTSEASQKSESPGYTRTSLGLGRSFGPVDVKVTEAIWYYFQQIQTAGYDSKGQPVQNLDYRLWTLLDLSWNLSKKFAINLETGFMNQRAYPDESAQFPRPAVYQDNIIMNPELSYSFNDNFTLSLGIWEMYNMRAQPVLGTDRNGVPYTVSSYTPLEYHNGSEGYFQTTLKF